MDKPLKLGGDSGSVTASTALLNQKLGISPSRSTEMVLTASEIESLRQDKQQAMRKLRELIRQQGIAALR